MAGNVPPDISTALMATLSNQAKLIEVQDLVDRIEKLEEQSKNKP